MSLTALLPRALSSRHAAACLMAAAAVIVSMAAPALAEEAAIRREANVAREQRECQAKALVARGRQLLAAKAYAEARDAFRQALRLTPDDAACRKLLTETDAALGTAGGKGILAKVKERRAFTAQAIVRQLDTELFEAKRTLDTDPQQAARRAQRVLEGVAYVKDSTRASTLRTRAQSVLNKANARVQSAAAERRKTALAEARALGSQRAHTRTTTVRDLREKGCKHLEAGRHDEALAVADELLRHDSANTDAAKLKDQVRLARLSGTTLRGRSAARRESTSNLMKELEAELAPPAQAQVVLPGNKKDEAKHAPVEDRPLEKWELELRAKLAEPISIEFRETPLD